ncbi:MAG: efflux RND transporter periplasmic adaptor subunit [Bacteroidota bacterium]
MIKYSLFLFFLATVVVACQEAPKVEENFVRPVKYETVGYANVQKMSTFSGTAQTDKVVNLSFRNTGIITQFNVNLGQRVRRGQLLGKLDNVQARLAYEQSITQLNSAESQMNTAKLSLNRVRTLFEKGSAALSDFESAKNAYKTAEEGFQSAKRGVAIQKEQIQFGYLYAPASGVISKVLAEKDENVNPGQTVAVLNAGDNMEIVVGIPESVINGVQQDMTAAVDFSALPNKKFTAQVTEIAPAVDANTATYPVKLAVKGTKNGIKSGMAANVTFNFSEPTSNDSTLIVPLPAVGEDSNGRFVFLIEEKGENATVKKHPIKIGQINQQGFEVTSGLSAGQKIATAGLQTLLDGQTVKLRDF